MSKSLFAIAVGVLLALTGAVRPSIAAQNGPESPAEESLAPLGNTLSAPFAQAIAIVGQSGSVIKSKGFGAVTSPSTGIVCLKLVYGLHIGQTAPILSIDWNHSLGVVLFAQWDSGHPDCTGPVGRMIEVRTYKGDTGGVGSPYQVPVLSDQVAFEILVP
jgi:hypothetical protein